MKQVNIGLRVLTRPMPAKLPELYRTLGTDYAERVLPSIIQVGSSLLSMLTWITLSLLIRYPSPFSKKHTYMQLAPLPVAATSCVPFVQETLKSVIAQYNASQLLTMREVSHIFSP